MIRALAVAALVVLGACSGDERDRPDDTRPLGTITAPNGLSVTSVPATIVNPPPASSAPGGVCDGSAPDASDVAACVASSLAAAVAPPVTCGPDPDETHPPPCD